MVNTFCTEVWALCIEVNNLVVTQKNLIMEGNWLIIQFSTKWGYSFKVPDCHLWICRWSLSEWLKGQRTAKHFNALFAHTGIFSLTYQFHLSTSACVHLYLHAQGPAGNDGAPGLPGAVGAKVWSSRWIVLWPKWAKSKSYRLSPLCLSSQRGMLISTGKKAKLLFLCLKLLFSSLITTFVTALRHMTIACIDLMTIKSF